MAILAIIGSLPSASAQASAAESVSAFSRLEMGGDVVLRADLQALSLQSPEPGSSQILALDAGSILVRTAFEPALQTPDTSARQASGLRRTILEAATLTARPTDSNARLAVFATGHGAQAAFVSGFATVEPEIAQSTSEERFVHSSAPLLTVPTTGALSIHNSADQARMRISGSFVVVAWSWDFSGSAQGTAQFLSSGPATTGLLPLAASVAPQGAQNEQLYLTITDGTLDLAVTGIDDLRFWSNEIHVDAADLITFQGTNDAFANGERLPLRWHLQQLRDASPITLRASGAIGHPSGLLAQSTVLGSMPLSKSTRLSVPGWMDTELVLVAGTVLAPGAVALTVAARRRLESAAFSRLEDAAENGDVDTALRLSTRLTASKHYGRDATLLRVDALLRTNQIDEGSSLLAKIEESTDAHWNASVELLRGYMHAVAGDHAAAAAAVARCLAFDPEHYDEVCDSPSFAKARAFPAVRRALAQISSGGAAS